MIVPRVGRSVLLAIVALVVTVHATSAHVASTQALPIGSEIFLPLINANIPHSPLEEPPDNPPATRPTPYDVHAQDIAIGLGDMPDGFYLDTAEPIEVADVLLEIGMVSGYNTLLINDDALFFDAFGVGSLVHVFWEPAGAQLLFDAFTWSLQEDPAYQQLSISTYGDAASAFVLRDVVEGFTVELFRVVVRKGNVTFVVDAFGLASVTELADATVYVQRMLNKIERGQVAGSMSEAAPVSVEAVVPLDAPSAALHSRIQQVEAQLAAQLAQ